MHQVHLIVGILITVRLLVGCGGASDTPAPTAGTSVPTQLTFAGLMRTEMLPAAPVQTRLLSAPSDATDGQPLIARLSSPGTVLATNGAEMFNGSLSYRALPPFELDIFSQGDMLIPVQRGILATHQNAQFWQLIFSPGRIWQQRDDQGMSRGQLVVTLVNPYYANAHNGVLTFLYKDGQISQGWLQIFQENVDWLKQDFWGTVPLALTDKTELDMQSAKTHWQWEQQMNLPRGAWQSLAEIATDASLSAYTSSIAEHNLSATGLIYQGRLYAKPLNTRYGPFPYPEAMRHGVYSVSKSMAAALTLFRLAQVYGAEVLHEKIIAHIPQGGLHHGWQQVTFSQALSMATGTGDAYPDADILATFADEHFEPDSRMTLFSLARSSNDKLRHALAFGDYPWGPGEIVRYNTSVTFVLAVAMQHYLASQGDTRPLWQMMQEDVYARLGMSHFAMMHTTEADAQTAIPIMGVGIYPTEQDTAKLALLLQQKGIWQGEQLLSSALIEEILSFNQDTGLPADATPSLGRRYHHSFWAQPMPLSATCAPMVPFMLGYGNNYVMFPGNDIVLYRYQDSFNNDKLSMLKLADDLQAICP
ncbi:serine hydrolase [Bowmanella denitrificans]|uniref:serine hydrolase n=1 Tax=Bowmanella denitrificans TaxID=366582 RepID=UPI001558898A|nr:serine hydrolase [Bowmanella denitrificans]